MQLVEATQMVAARASLVRCGAPAHLGQLLPMTLQLWSQDRLSHQFKELESSEALRSLRSSYSEELRDTAVKLAADASLSEMPKGREQQDSDSLQERVGDGVVSATQQQLHKATDEGSLRREGCPGSWKTRTHLGRLRSAQLLSAASDHSAPSDGPRLRQQHAAAGLPGMSSAEYLTIEEDDPSNAGATDTPWQTSQTHMSAAGQQLLLLLRVLRNLCATGSDATRAMADVGVPAQVACLISDPLQSNPQGALTYLGRHQMHMSHEAASLCSSCARLGVAILFEVAITRACSRGGTSLACCVP